MSTISQVQQAPAASSGFCLFSHLFSLGARLMKMEKAGQSLVLLALRVLYGFGFAMAGWGKFGNLEGTGQYFASLGVPLPGFTAGLVATTELVGGVLLLLGLGTRLATLPLIATMVVAMITAHAAAIVDVESFMAQSPYPFLLVSLVLLAFGPGAASVDRLLKGFFARRAETES
ncbi:MAG: DoxX family protein [Deltaproteobacteria bacterium]|nr:DoxX family protein [Deltaproteobacteria bacterium]